MAKKTFSIITAFVLGFLCVSPPEFLKETSHFALTLGAQDPIFKEDFRIPVMVNSFAWICAVVFAGLLGFYLVSKKFHPAIKFLAVYLFVGAFVSEVPYRSFNAYLLIAPTLALFLWLRECDFDEVIRVLCAAFWLELTFACFRLAGMETLMNFGREEGIFFGTINQHMQFASLLCIISPFLLLRSKWYIVPISAAVVLCTSSGFAISILAGILVYLTLRYGRAAFVLSKEFLRWEKVAGLSAVFGAIGYAIYLGRDSFAVAWREGRFPVWGVIFKSWLFDTRVNPDQSGPFSLKSFLFGHGTDSFYSIFAAYKHDANPFGQAHNCWLQLPWEIGLIGFVAILVYVGWLAVRLYQSQEHELLAGMVIISTNMLVHFPTRMTQTIWLIVAYLALCEQRSNWRIR